MQNQIHPKTLNQIACCILAAVGIASLVANAHSAEAVSPSELLEKGIYSQETNASIRFDAHSRCQRGGRVSTDRRGYQLLLDQAAGERLLVLGLGLPKE